MQELTSIEICAGGGGQALGLAQAGFRHLALVENDKHACQTLRQNRKSWRVYEKDVRDFLKEDASKYHGRVSLLAGGVPCPPFSKAGLQLGRDDERDLFPVALGLVAKIEPAAVMLENVRGLLDKRFLDYRNEILATLDDLGYAGEWSLLQASDFGVPQLRPRAVLVALKSDMWEDFRWPGNDEMRKPNTVGRTLRRLMKANGWEGADEWALLANDIAPTLVGGSKKHGGADLGPTRAKSAWERLSVDGWGLANEAPGPAYRVGKPRLTVEMTARLQGFPPSWEFCGGKTAAYRQVGNAFPPPVAKAVGLKIRRVIEASALSRLPEETSAHDRHKSVDPSRFRAPRGEGLPTPVLEALG